MTYNQLRKKHLAAIHSAYMPYYIGENKYGIEFLRDAMAYLNDRSEVQNEHKSYLELLAEFAREVHYEHSTYQDFEKREAENKVS